MTRGDSTEGALAVEGAGAGEGEQKPGRLPEAMGGVASRHALLALPEPLLVIDENGTLELVNKAAETLLGWDDGSLVGESLTVVIPERLRTAHWEGFRRWVRDGRSSVVGHPLRVPALRRDGSEIEVDLRIAEIEATSSSRRFIGTMHATGAEMVLLQDERTTNKHLRAVNRIATLLGRHNVSVDEVGARVLEIVGSGLGWDVGALWIVDEAARVLRAKACWSASGVDAEELIAQTSSATLQPGESLAGRAWLTGRPVWFDDIGEDATSPRGRSGTRAGLRGWMAVPIASGAYVQGALEVIRRTEEPLDHEMAETLSMVGQLLGQFVDRVRAEQELRASTDRFSRLARTLQRSLLPPKLPTLPWMEVAAVYRPGAMDADVGGDFYDLFAARGQSWCLALGDVCGRGVSAATLSGLARHTIRAASMQTNRPAAALRTLNSVVEADSEPEAFLTAVCARLRPLNGGIGVTLASGGHPPPVLVRASGEATLVGEPGSLIGMFPDVNLPECSFSLGDGDLLVFYTDGVTETRSSADGAFLGDHLIQLLSRSFSSAMELASLLEHTVAEFGRGSERDDLAIVVIRSTPGL